jgi:tetratricopeptide (TPR) repeat protein
LTARALNMSRALYRDLFQLDETRRRNEEAAELDAAAGFANAVLQSGIDQLFTELARAEARWPELWERSQNTKGWHHWLMAGRLAEAKAEIALAKGDHAEAARLAVDAIHQSREVRRAKYELAARLVLGGPLMALGQAERGIDDLRAALDGIRRLGHPPTLWQASWTLGTALAQAGKHDDAASAVAAAEAEATAVAAAANTLLDGLERWTLLLGAGGPERSAIGTEQEQGIRSRPPALVEQQQTWQMCAASLRPGRPSGRAAAVGS